MDAATKSVVTMAILCAVTSEAIVGAIPALAGDPKADAIAFNAVQKQVTE